jgi:putative hydrolase
MIMWRAFADYHTHTRYSNVGGTIKDNVLEAKRKGLEEIGISDHGPANWGHYGRTRLADFDRIIEETHRVQSEIPGIIVRAGVEADIISYDGELDIPLAMQQKLDQVLAGFHITVIPKYLGEGAHFLAGRALSRLSGRVYQRIRTENTKAVVEAVYHNKINIITHPGLGISIDTPELARACVKRDTALEINSKHGIKSVAFIQTAAREGVSFAIGSDAHEPSLVGDLNAGIKAAQLAGLTPEQIINVRDE